MRVCWLAVTAVVSVLGAEGAGGQSGVGQEERWLREAASRESGGDYPGAEAMLRRLLSSNPSSSGGLFALERVLRAQGRAEDVLVAADTFLAHDPSAAGVRYLKLRVLAELDSLARLEDEARAWFAADPGSSVPYREVARVFERALGPARALDLLREGRSVVGAPDALALEIGDLLASTGDLEGAIREWTRAVRADGSGWDRVARRLSGRRAAAGAGAQVVRSLARSREPGRVRAALDLALQLKLSDEALEAGRTLLGRLSGRERAALLSDVGREARERGLPRVAAWAYAAMGADASSATERRTLDRRIVELSLRAADTVAALAALRRMAASHGERTVERRQASALRIRLEVASAEPQDLRGLLERFRLEFPEAPELDDLGATVAAGLLARGDLPGARAALDGIEGPRSATERAYLLLDEGQVEAGRAALLAAAGGLAPSAATDVIQLAAVLDRLGPEGRSVMARAAVLAHRRRTAEAVALLEAGLERLALPERPSVLAEGARLAQRGGHGAAAASLRRRILEDHSEAPERSEAALSLARHHARVTGRVAEAVRILEDLIADRPNAAVVPSARRELERIRSGGGSG